MNRPKYIYAICQKFNPMLHGWDDNSSKGIDGYYLVMDTIMCFQSLVRAKYFVSNQNSYYYYTGVNSKSTIELVEPIFMDEGGEIIGIFKTFWLRIFQRSCRIKLEKQRAKLSKHRKLSTIMNREINGK